jgi:vancomycin resistance protein VanJ
MTTAEAQPRRAPPALGLIGRVARTLIQVLVGSYGLSLSGFLTLRAISGDSLTLVDILNSYVHLVLLLAPLALLPALVLRKRLPLSLLILPLWTFVTSYGGQFLPRSAPLLPANAPQLHLLTYNLLRHNTDTAALIGIIRGAGADVVALQEVTPAQAAAFEADLRDLYPYQALHPQEGFSGQGVLSRYPILADAFWQIHLGHQRVEIDFNGRQIALYNAHPIHPFIGGYPNFYQPSTRAAEVDELLRRAAAETLPVLLVGDFNLSDQESLYRQITAHYADAYRQAGWGMGFTFPAGPLPLARIDYVFHDAAFVTLSAQVGSSGGGSDHLPLSVLLGMVNNTGGVGAG